MGGPGCCGIPRGVGLTKVTDARGGCRRGTDDPSTVRDRRSPGSGGAGLFGLCRRSSASSGEQGGCRDHHAVARVKTTPVTSTTQPSPSTTTTTAPAVKTNASTFTPAVPPAPAPAPVDHDDDNCPVPTGVRVEQLRCEGQYGSRHLFDRTAGPDSARVREHRTGVHGESHRLRVSARQHRQRIGSIGVVERGAGIGGMPVDLHGTDRAGGELVAELLDHVGTGLVHPRTDAGVSRRAGSGRSVRDHRAEQWRLQPDSGGAGGDGQPHPVASPKPKAVPAGRRIPPGRFRQIGAVGRQATGRSPDLSRPPGTLS